MNSGVVLITALITLIHANSHSSYPSYNSKRPICYEFDNTKKSRIDDCQAESSGQTRELDNSSESDYLDFEFLEKICANERAIEEIVQPTICQSISSEDITSNNDSLSNLSVIYRQSTNLILEQDTCQYTSDFFQTNSTQGVENYSSNPQNTSAQKENDFILKSPISVMPIENGSNTKDSNFEDLVIHQQFKNFLSQCQNNFQLPTISNFTDSLSVAPQEPYHLLIPSIDESSSETNTQQTAIPYISKDGLTIYCPWGVLSWIDKFTKKYRFQSFFKFPTANNDILYFGTDEYTNLVFFKYSSHMFNFFSANLMTQSGDIKSTIIKSIQAILSTIYHLDKSIQPSYYLFKCGRFHCGWKYRYFGAKLYFFFTTISYLLQRNNYTSETYLIALLKEALNELSYDMKFASHDWNFLKELMQQNFNISIVFSSKKTKNSRYDITVVSFIYHEMKFGANEKVKDFFKQTWIAGMTIMRKKTTIIQLSELDQLTIPSKIERGIIAFEIAARKLYQIEFGNILFGNWESLDSLLESYSRLKLDFKSILVDFRVRIFTKTDFEQLDKTLKKIHSLVSCSPVKKMHTFQVFFTELSYFVNFKCILFTYDFYKEQQNGLNVTRSLATFESFKSIKNSLNAIHDYFITNGIQLDSINLDRIQSIPNNNFSLDKLVDEISSVVEHFNNSSSNQIQIESLDFEVLQSSVTNKLLSKSIEKGFSIPFLKKFNYFENDIGLSSIGLTRFEYVEFITELRNYLNRNRKVEMKKIFSAEKYKLIREMWLFFPTEEKNSCFADERCLLERFEIFLFLFGQ